MGRSALTAVTFNQAALHTKNSTGALYALFHLAQRIHQSAFRVFDCLHLLLVISLSENWALL